MIRPTWTGRFLAGMAVGALALSGTGCDKLPWNTKSTEPEAQATPAPATPPAPVSAVPERERVATVNQDAISRDDIEAALREVKQLTLAYGQEWKPLPAEEDPAALDLTDVVANLVGLELKAQDAKARGLDRRPEVQQRLQYIQRTFLAQEWDRFQRDLATPTEAEIHKFYEDYKLGFLDPERIQIRQIVTQTLADAEAARSRAVQGAPFQQLAVEVSIGPEKDKGGDVGWVLKQVDRDRLAMMGVAAQETTLFSQLESVAFTLERNQISQPVKGPDGKYYVVQLVDRKDARQRTELEVRDQIKEALTVQKIQEQLEQLRKKADVKEYPERLEGIEQ